MRRWLRVPAPGAAVFVIAIQVAAADDLYDYGEYLAAECTSCHRLDGVQDPPGGIPSLVALAEADFIAALRDYQIGARSNAIMENVARSLGDEEIAALARFFARQRREQQP